MASHAHEIRTLQSVGQRLCGAIGAKATPVAQALSAREVHKPIGRRLNGLLRGRLVAVPPHREIENRAWTPGRTAGQLGAPQAQLLKHRKAGREGQRIVLTERQREDDAPDIAGNDCEYCSARYLGHGRLDRVAGLRPAPDAIEAQRLAFGIASGEM